MTIIFNPLHVPILHLFVCKKAKTTKTESIAILFLNYNEM